MRKSGFSRPGPLQRHMVGTLPQRAYCEELDGDRTLYPDTPLFDWTPVSACSSPHKRTQTTAGPFILPSCGLQSESSSCLMLFHLR